MEDSRTDLSLGAPPIGVLALQGSFDLHLRALERLGAPACKVRLPGDLEGLGGLIIPGGESTVMAGVAQECGLFEPLRRAVSAGLPAFGTCAGAILLGRGDDRPERLGIAPLTLDRNAYGRQRESFHRAIRLEPFEDPFPCVFIRAPRIRSSRAGDDREVEVLGRDGSDPVLVRWRRLLLATFHPELTEDLRLHRFFLELAARGRPAPGGGAPTAASTAAPTAGPAAAAGR